MKSEKNLQAVILTGLMIAIFLLPMESFAQFATANSFESKIQGLTTKIITVILPLCSVLGLVYASILAVSGDMAAKTRMIAIVVCSIVGLLAQHIVEWLKAAVGY